MTLLRYWPLARLALTLTQPLWGTELVNMGGRGGALKASFHCILDLELSYAYNIHLDTNNHWSEISQGYLCVSINVWSLNFTRIYFHFCHNFNILIFCKYAVWSPLTKFRTLYKVLRTSVNFNGCFCQIFSSYHDIMRWPTEYASAAAYAKIAQTKEAEL